MHNWIQTWIYNAFEAHCAENHNAEFEACRDPRCRRAYLVERLLRRWLYGEENHDG